VRFDVTGKQVARPLETRLVDGFDSYRTINYDDSGQPSLGEKAAVESYAAPQLKTVPLEDRGTIDRLKLQLTLESDLRKLVSSRVAIDRHPSALASGHDGALRVSCP
jgi:hypothetical protein